MSYQAGDFRDIEINVHRAGAVGSLHVPTLCVMAHQEMPDDIGLEAAVAIYEEEAAKLVDALATCLPGGLLDRVLVKLMERQVSSFRIAHQRLSIAASRSSGDEQAVSA